MAFLFDWSKMEPEEYTHDDKAVSLVLLGERNYIMLEGQGDENSKQFLNDAQAMLQLGEYLTQAGEHGIEIDGFKNYVHYPLDVTWENGLNSKHQQYKMMMKHPNFMPKAAVQQAIEQLKAENSRIGDIEYIRFEEGFEAQIAAKGLNSSEVAVEKINDFINNSPFRVDNSQDTHQELYLNDITKLPQDQWQIIIRQKLQRTPNESKYSISYN